MLAVTALDRDFERARTVSRAVAQAITFEGKYYRKDIGWREAERRS